MKWTEDSAKKKIISNGGTVKGKQIAHSHPGLKLLGAIDYLVNHHKYTWFKK